jgi:hypothetical protein
MTSPARPAFKSSRVAWVDRAIAAARDSREWVAGRVTLNSKCLACGRLYRARACGPEHAVVAARIRAGNPRRILEHDLVEEVLVDDDVVAVYYREVLFVRYPPPPPPARRRPRSSRRRTS